MEPLDGGTMRGQRFPTANVSLNDNGNNTLLSMHPVDDETMRELGFIDRDGDGWYLCRPVSDDSDITLNVIIDTEDDDWRIDVLDERYLQPYDYQMILNANPDRAYARMVADKCEEWFRKLSDAGVLDGWKPGMYV